MSKITLSQIADITQATTAQTTINSNSTTVQTAFDNTLSRDGTQPNTMLSNLDMNSNQIINLPAPNTVNSPARLIDVITPIPVPSTILSSNNVYTGTNSFSAASTFNGTATFNSTVTVPVNSIPNSELAQMATNTIKGNNTGGTANAADLTVAQVSTLLTGAANTNTWTSDQYFKSGRPWADVRAFGALGNNSNDDTSAIQSACTAVFNNFGGGVVYFPPGNYKTTSTITVKGGTLLLGNSISSTSINGNGAPTDFTVLVFDSTINGGGIEKIFVGGFINNTTTQNAVTVAGVQGIMRDVNVWGGFNALSVTGTDWLFENVFPAGYSNHIASTGANWYLRCKIDQAGLAGATPTNGFLQGASSGIAENHFSLCDLSGNYTNSVTINDTTATHAITTFEGCVFSAPIIITNAKGSMFSACEIGSTTFTVGTNLTAVTGCIGTGSAIVISGAGKTLAGNINIT